MPIDVVFRRWIVFLVKSRPDRSRFLTLLIQDKVDTLVKNPNRRRNVMVFVDLGTKKSFMQAKFDRVMLPIARELIVEDQLSRVTFNAFFENVMFHEVAHGLGIKNTIDGKGTVRAALKEKAGALEEGKADILGLYMIRQLNTQGELGKESIEDNYITFVASLFRSMRFGAADAHGRANIVAFNFLLKAGAFTREANGKYRVDAAKMRMAADELSRLILVLQGNGDYDGVVRLNTELGTITAQTQADLDRLKARGIPIDIVYDQEP